MGDTVWATDFSSPMVISSVDPVTGNLLVYGQPFFMVRGDDVDYITALAYGGYRVTEWDVHLAALVNAGMNCISTNWDNFSSTNYSSSLFDDLVRPFNRNQNADLSHWQRFGTYMWGDAAGNSTPPPGGTLHLVPPDVPWFHIYMDAHVNQPNLLLWQVSGELQSGASIAVWQPVYQAVRSIDPTRAVGDYILINNPNLSSFCDLSVLQLPIPEVVENAGPWPLIRSTNTKTALQSHGETNAAINAMDTAWNAGRRFVYGISHQIPEIGNLTDLWFSSTTSTTSVSASTSTIVTPATMSFTAAGLTWSIIVGTVLKIDASGALEYVTVTAVTGTTFTAFFKNAHSGTWTIDTGYPGTYALATRLQMRRAYWYAVARNCRLLALLFGPVFGGFPYPFNGDARFTSAVATTIPVWDRNNPDTYTIYTAGVDGAVTDPELTPLLDNGRLPTILDILGYVAGVWADITSLKNVILDGQRWTHLTTNPQDVGSNTGIYASLKTIGIATYVIACNQHTVSTVYPGETYNKDVQVNNATITVGTGTTAVRLFEAGSPTFSGGVITDNFRPMETHVYKVT